MYGLRLRLKSILTNRLAVEVLHMVTEGLSNIRRHTHATRATIVLARHADRLVLRIENDCPDGVQPDRFTPWSITERAAALGGQAYVEQHEDSGTAVVVEIPL